MKNLIFLVSTILFFSCNKEVLDKEQIDNKSIVANNSYSNEVSAGRYGGSVTLNSRGYLDFATREDYGKFVNYLDTAKHGDVKNFLSEIGFLSMGQEIYESTRDNDTLTDAEIKNYLFDSSGFVGIERVVIRQMADTGFILTCLSNNITNSVYQNMRNGIYVSSMMNKFAKNIERSSNFDLIDFVHATPSGYEEATNPSTYVVRRKLFGWGTVTTTHPAPEYGEGYCMQWECDKFFVFGIGVSGNQNCQATVLVMCNN